jgi:hypothetical protein
MLKKIAAILVIATFATQANGRGFDLRLADETAEILYLTESSTFGYGGADVGMGVLFNENDDLMFSGAVMVSGHGAGNNRALKFGAGAKFVFALLDDRNNTLADEEFGALAIGGQVRYVVPSSTPVAFLAEGFIAPSIVSFSGADQYTEYRFAIELEVTPSARAYVGYRNIEFEMENGLEIELDDDPHIGVRIEF